MTISRYPAPGIKHAFETSRSLWIPCHSKTPSHDQVLYTAAGGCPDKAPQRVGDRGSLPRSYEYDVSVALQPRSSWSSTPAVSLPKQYAEHRHVPPTAIFRSCQEGRIFPVINRSHNNEEARCRCHRSQYPQLTLQLAVCNRHILHTFVAVKNLCTGTTPILRQEGKNGEP
jgi:hypothetical protein